MTEETMSITKLLYEEMKAFREGQGLIIDKQEKQGKHIAQIQTELQHIARDTDLVELRNSIKLELATHQAECNVIRKADSKRSLIPPAGQKIDRRTVVQAVIVIVTAILAALGVNTAGLL